jgi:sigma-54 specific flagellar transcriptional regulator A
MSDPYQNPLSPAPQLPATLPDLVVEGGGEEWRVLRLSPTVAKLAGLDAAEARGRRLEHLLSGAVPSLTELARDAAERDESLAGIRVRLRDGEGMTLIAEVVPGGLSEDYRRRRVSFTFRPLAAVEAKSVAAFQGLIGTGAAMREVFRKIALYAPAEAAVVVTGETGTGKELVARALHERSTRAAGPYVAVNCSAIAEELLESELFGHEKGAFTGAVRTHKGRFERADGGTLFLDEIGDMPLHTQSRLLRALEAGRIERVGAEEERKIDVRVVAATNVPLEQAVGLGRFRADLYHRLSVLRIHLPPLRERPEDIPALVDHFLHVFSRKYGRRIERLTSEAIALLQSYFWPGNVRELRNVLERVFVETQSEVIGARAFTEWVRERQDFAPGQWGEAAAESRSSRPIAPPYPLISAQRLLAAGPQTFLEAELLPARPSGRRSTRPLELDAEEIGRAYRAAGGNLAGAARLLGVHRATLYRYLERLQLRREDLAGEGND